MYDLSGKVTSIIYSDTYTVTNTYYPGTGLINTVTGTPSGGSAVEYAKCTKYEPYGKIGKITHTYNNTKTEYTYDLKSTRLMELKTTGSGGNIQNKTYTYTQAGDIHTITDKLIAPNIIYTYAYDNLHRLLSETTSVSAPPTDADIMVYNYDDSEHINAVTTINYNGTDYNFSYDANGNMKDGWDLTDPNNIVERDITWNADNMPFTVTRGSATTNLTYDGDGARAKKIEVGTITSATYYISNDYEIKDGTLIKYIFAGNLRIAEVEDSASAIFHKDHLGSSTAMTNSAGAKIEATDYLPFGGMREHTGLDISDFKFTDQEHDNESSLYNYDARLYDPVIARFISVDPFVQAPYIPQSLNRYSYCLNNPMIYTDPSGNFSWPWEWDWSWIYGGSNAEKEEKAKTIGEKAYDGFQDFFNPQLPDEFKDWTKEEQWGYIENVHIKKTTAPFKVAADIGAGGSAVPKKSVASLLGRVKSRIISLFTPKSIRIPFKSGDIIIKEMATSKGTLEMAAETIINGKTLHLKDIAVYPRGAESLNLGAKEVMALRNQLAAEAKSMGFETLRITGKRLTGANPGKIVDLTIDLTK